MHYKYFNKETNREEKVTKELWCWEAIYNDGTELKQFDDNGNFHRFSEIEVDKLHVFRMKHDQSERIMDILFDSSTMKLIHFYRNVILRAGQSDEERMRV